MDLDQIVQIVVDLSVRYSFQVLAAVAILGLGVICARVVGGFIERSLARTTIEVHLQRLLIRAAKVLVLLFTSILALDKFGVQVTALVAGISVAGVAASFALQGVLGNLAAGLSIMLSRNFRIGDYVEIGTVKGQVQAIDLTMKAEDFWPVHYEIYRALLARFRQEQIEIPYPHREVRLLQEAA